VADSSNDRIQKFDSSGTYLGQWGSDGVFPGEFREANGIAVDSRGDVYVVDKAQERVQKFDGSGTLLTYWGAAGTGPGEFNDPWGVTTAPGGIVYVADRGNDRMQKFGPLFEVIVAEPEAPGSR
jgi:DNA-binding beta-propeller fold protein YncE